MHMLSLTPEDPANINQSIVPAVTYTEAPLHYSLTSRSEATTCLNT